MSRIPNKKRKGSDGASKNKSSNITPVRESEEKKKTTENKKEMFKFKSTSIEINNVDERMMTEPKPEKYPMNIQNQEQK